MTLVIDRLLAMGLLRMIKLFAWESKINDRLRAKREDELVWIRKGRIMNLLNMNLKFVVVSASRR